MLLFFFFKFQIKIQSLNHSAERGREHDLCSYNIKEAGRGDILKLQNRLT
jgi:hypothetical protein